MDVGGVHDRLNQLLQCLYKGVCVCACVYCCLLLSVPANTTTSPLVTAGCMYFIRVLRGCAPPPPAISPVTTRAGRKRKLNQQDLSADGNQSSMAHHGQLDVTLLTQWLSAALHDFMTVK